MADRRARAVLLWVALLIACSSHDASSSSSSAGTALERRPAPFACDQEECALRHPRLPDDGEWSCSDMGGVAVCVGGDAPAGIPKNVRDPTWACGLRRVVHAQPSGERVCVDYDSEFPDGKARGWTCRYPSDHGLSRVCRRDASAHQIGDPCDAKHPCLDGLDCTAARCVPPRNVTPSCAFDRDCESHACRFGTCRSETTGAAR